ncbi:VOC family protein [Alkalicoccus luteus]|uniref:VOC family protein n=1 Tax=Alkalicoccus luteus TaxID=1237094 RepID=UPI004034AA73
MIKGIAHTAFVTGNMDKSLQFYCEDLGLEHAFQIKNDKDEPWIEYIKVAPRQYIELFYGGSGVYEPQKQEIGPHHFCLLVDSVDDVAERLKSRGLHLDTEPKRGVGQNRQCWVRDPDGNRIEFLEPDEDSPHNR